MDPNSVSLSTTQSQDEEVSPLKDSLSTQFSSGTSLPIRAPLSFDSDIETPLKINGNKLNNTMSRSSSISSQEGFLSGEDEFETASERPFIADPDEETLDTVMERETRVPFMVEPSNSPSMGTLFVPPKALVSGDDDDDDDSVADEGFVSGVDDDDDGSLDVSTVADSVKFPSVESSVPPKALVSGDDDVVADVGFVDEVENSGFSNVDMVPIVGVVESPEDSKITEENSSVENPNLTGKTEEVILSSEEKMRSFENNPSSALGSAESIVPVIIEAPVEDIVMNKKDTSPENPKSNELGSPENKEEAEDVFEVEKKMEAEEIPAPKVEVSEADDVVVVEKKTEAGEIPAPKEAVTEAYDVVVVEKKMEAVEIPAPEEKMSEADDVVVVEKKIEVGDLVTETKDLVEMDETGVSDIKEVEVPVQKSLVLGGEDNQVQTSHGIEELVKSELSGVVNSSNTGDSHDDIKQPILVVLEKNDFEEDKVSETKIGETWVDKNDSLGIESEQAAMVVEEPVEPKMVEADTNVVIADAAQSSPAKGNMEKDDDDEMSARDVHGSVSKVREELKIEPETDSGAKQNEPVLNIVADEVGVNGLDENQLSASVPMECDPVTEFKHLDNGIELENEISSDTRSPESAIPRSVLDLEVKQEVEDEVKQEVEDEVDPEQDFEEDDDDSASDEGTEGLIFDGSETAEQIMKEMERGSGSPSGGESSQDQFQRIDGQIVMDSDEEVDTDEEEDGKELFDSATLAALLKAATNAGSDGGNVTITSSDGSRLFSIERPAGLGSSIRSLKPAPRTSRPNLFTPSDLTTGEESENELSEEEKNKLAKIQQIRVKFLRLVQRLGHSPEDSIAAQVLYRLVLAAGRQTSQSFSLDAARRTAMELEAEGKDDLDFSLNILVLGKTGVGKSATINSIFGEEKSHINPFEPGTTQVKEIIGTVDGVKIRVFDTPGLRSSIMEQSFNQKVLTSVKKLTKKNPPDILLYVDRLDTQTRDLNDMPLLRSITTTLGSAIWRSAIVTLTHAASAPPDGPSGHPLSYEMFVGQRSHIVQQSVGQAVGDLRMMNPSLMNPVSLVENHPSCRRNREGHRVLPNGQTWKPQLLLLCYSMKILSEASSLSKPQDPFDHRKLFGFRVRSPPLPYLLSSLLQSRAHPKLPADQGIENADSDIDLGDLSDSDQEEEEDEYDQLPPFKPLRKSQIAKLSKEQRKAYFEEYDYRVKLLQKKQWKEELKRMRDMKNKEGKDTTTNEFGFMGEDADQENDGPAAVPVPLPDMILPPSFDGDNPAYRYRFLEPTSQLLARPVLDTHGWDHDCGYDGVSLEESLAILGKFPAGVAVQITKDKKEFNIHLDSSVATKHGENGSTLAGFDIQTIGKQLGYIVKGETKFKNLKKNKTAAGVAITFLGESVATGLKIEDQIAIGKRLILSGSTGTVRSQGDAAYGANVEVRLKEKDFPIDQDQSTLGLSLMKWRGDLALGANLQSQFSIGRTSKMSVRVGLNNKLSGQITVKTSSSEQLQLAVVGLLPIAISIFRTIWPGAEGQTYSAY